MKALFIKKQLLSIDVETGDINKYTGPFSESGVKHLLTATLTQVVQ